MLLALDHSQTELRKRLQKYVDFKESGYSFTICTLPSQDNVSCLTFIQSSFLCKVNALLVRKEESTHRECLHLNSTWNCNVCTPHQGHNFVECDQIWSCIVVIVRRSPQRSAVELVQDRVRQFLDTSYCLQTDQIYPFWRLLDFRELDNQILSDSVEYSFIRNLNLLTWSTLGCMHILDLE